MSSTRSPSPEKQDFGADFGDFRGSLTRQVTVQLSPDQYERLFFQPTRAKGDLSRRLGNPTVLGLVGFLVPLTPSAFCLLGFQTATYRSLTAVSASYYFCGGIAMVLAGIAEFVLGNTYPMSVFIIYGCHWVNLGYTTDPSHPLGAAYGKAGESNPEYLSGIGFYSIAISLMSSIFMLGAIRVNLPFVLMFFCLIFIFAFNSEGFFELAKNPTPAGEEYATKMFKVAGGFAFAALIIGWYLVIITVCASTGVPCPLPIGDLSSRVFTKNEKAQTNEHAGYTTEEVPV